MYSLYNFFKGAGMLTDVQKKKIEGYLAKGKTTEEILEIMGHTVRRQQVAAVRAWKTIRRRKSGSPREKLIRAIGTKITQVDVLMAQVDVLMAQCVAIKAQINRMKRLAKKG